LIYHNILSILPFLNRYECSYLVIMQNIRFRVS